LQPWFKLREGGLGLIEIFLRRKIFEPTHHALDYKVDSGVAAVQYHMVRIPDWHSYITVMG